MKKTLLLTIMISFGLTSYLIAQDSKNIETGKIYFLRSTGYDESATAFTTFIDNKFVCKLNNKKYSVHEVPAGKHECSVQVRGKEPKEKAEKIEITVEPGKIYYVQVVLETGVFANNIYCEEMTENTATRKMKKMVEDIKCL